MAVSICHNFQYWKEPKYFVVWMTIDPHSGGDPLPALHSCWQVVQKRKGKVAERRLMPFEPAEFFREVTVRICGSLQIEKALFDTFRFLRRHLPVDEASYTHFAADMGMIRFVAAATHQGGKDLGLTPMPLPPDLFEWMRRDRHKTEGYVLNRPGDHPLSRLLTDFRGMDPDTSILVLRLILEGEFLGSFNLACAGVDRYTEAHVRRLAAVREPLAIALANGLQHRETLRLKELKEEDNRYLKEELRMRANRTVVGADFGLREVMQQVRQVAGAGSPVLLRGDTGTGKEVIAGAIHDLSPRRDGPFVAVNCGAIPDSLVDSELFGHEKGAFTGAVAAYRGRFERASGGTIFLDEIGELPSAAQVRLLRVLQQREIERVGGAAPIAVDIRIIAATHRDLEAMTARGEFRQDLFYRLNVFPIQIPPLRARQADIPALVQHILRKKGGELGIRRLPEVTQAFLEPLMAYDWPGNVRELENAVERALILRRGDTLVAGAPARAETVRDTAEAFPTLDEVVKRHIRAGLAHCRGRIEGEGGLAELMGVQPNTLRARMRKLAIPFGRKARHGN